jgi:hypothetical protein
MEEHYPFSYWNAIGQYVAGEDAFAVKSAAIKAYIREL